jgi:hypothetical protein
LAIAKGSLEDLFALLFAAVVIALASIAQAAAEIPADRRNRTARKTQKNAVRAFPGYALCRGEFVVDLYIWGH